MTFGFGLCSVLYEVGFTSASCTFFYFRVRFLTKPGFWFGLFLLCTGSLPSHSNQCLHCVLSLAAQCIVIGPVCNGRAGLVCLWLCGSVTMVTGNCVH